MIFFVMMGTKTVHSELNGCVVKSELLSNEYEENNDEERRVLGWHSMVNTLLPGSQFSGARRETMEWFANILELSDFNHVQGISEESKLKFLAYSKKLSDSYQNAMSHGVKSDKGAALIQDCTRYRACMKESATEVANQVVNSLFEAGNQICVNTISILTL
jgi:hypothetical protein